MDNPFDAFDADATEANPFDRFDAPAQASAPSMAENNRLADAAMAGPEGEKLRGQLQSRANKQALEERGLGPGYAALSAAGNTAFLNAPRNIIAGAKSLSKGTPFDQEYDALKRLDEAAAEQYPRATTAGDVGGVLGQVLALPQAGPASLLGRTVAGRMAGGALTGGGLEGAKTFADTKDVGQAAKAAAWGALLGAGATPLGERVIAPAARKVGELTGFVAPKAAVPTTEELFQKGGDAYRAAENAGVMFAPQAIGNLHQSIAKELYDKGFTPKLQGAVKPALDELYKATIPGPSGTPSTLTLQGLDTIRKIAQNAVTSPDKSTRKMGGILKRHIDDFVNNMGPQSVISGNSPEAKDAVNAARDLWARASKAETIEDALQRAEWRAGSTYSGGNVNNATRQNLRSILYQDLKTPGRWTPDELAQVEQTVMGTPGGNLARTVGNKLNPKGLMGGAEALYGLFGLMHGDPTQALQALGAAGIGMGAKAYGDRATQQSVDDLLRLVRSGGNRANLPGVLSPSELQTGRNLAIAGEEASPPAASTMPTPSGPSPSAASVARGGVAGATPKAGALPTDVTPQQPDQQQQAAPNEWAQPAPKQLPYGHVFVRDKKNGSVRVFDRTRGEFVGESAAQ